MGDRFYEAQKNHKPKRRLKAEVLNDLEAALGKRVEGMDRLTIKALDELIEAIYEVKRA